MIAHAGRGKVIPFAALAALCALARGAQGTSEVSHSGANSGSVADFLPRMWAQLEAASVAGSLQRHSGSDEVMAPPIDCKGRLLAYQYALKLQPNRKPQRATFDALELGGCGVTPPPETPRAVVLFPLPPHASADNTFYVSPHGSDANPGTEAKPFKTVEKALASARALPKASGPGVLVLLAGVHFLSKTITLGAADSGLTITGHPSGQQEAWLSGGVPLTNLQWTKWGAAPNASWNVWVADVPKGVADIPGLNTLGTSAADYRRVTRARFPNALASEGAELCTDCWASGVKHWHKDLSCVGQARTVYIDLRNCSDDMTLPDGSPCKNDSAMWDTYNTYSNGHGGCCAAWSGDDSPHGPMGNYFCGNSSGGGWVGYDDPRGKNHTQGLSPALPYGFDYDPTDLRGGGPFLKTIKNASGAVMHVWRDQGWFVNMFEVANHDVDAASFSFATMESRGVKHVKGGWQGGRGWQVNASAINSTEYEYLLANKWMIENVIEALDAENEWFFDAASRKLYLWPNNTDSAPTEQYVATKLKTLVSINGTMASPVRDVTIQGLSFRDAADITMVPWGVPSGGDWGLYRGGAVFVEGAEGITVDGNLFQRLDGNGVFVSGYTRNVTVSNNEFVWIGCSAMAGWGYTNENDGTDGQQPRFTYLLNNYVHELGHYEKQSSMWFQAKLCQTVIKGNINFNGPRAGINFNDGFGGANNVSDNLIFNQCRESGDHGSMNSWDRTAYLSDVLTGKPSYEAAMSHVNNNFIIANYGASQGFDTDDGSSWYDIHDNFFWMADGWKMDYGGHDSRFADNIVYRGRPGGDGQNCFNSWPFLPGHGAEWSGNKCILPQDYNIGNLFHGCDCPGKAKPDGTGSSECGISFANNEYFTANGTATVACAKPAPSVQEWQKTTGSDKGSTVGVLPSDDQIMAWAKEKLGM